MLSGTPLENRLDDLYSIVQFVDDRRLGPGFRFFNKHRVVDEKGKVLGYKNLGELREALKPVLLRRTRDSVRLELPPRTTEILRIPAERRTVGRCTAGHMQIVAAITRKKFITEMDLLRLQKELLMCRMAADSTFLVDKQPPGYSTKLDGPGRAVEQLFAEEARKVVVFSEWTTMLDLIRAAAGEARNLGYRPARRQRAAKAAPGVGAAASRTTHLRLFLTTNAGSTG